MANADDVADMKAAIEELVRTYRGTTKEDLFTAWVLHMLAADDEAAAVKAVVNRKNERNIDGVYISGDGDSLVTITQTKYRIESVGAKNEPRNDLLGFADLAEALLGSDEDFARILPSDPKRMAKEVRRRCEAARKAIHDKEYKLHLVFATLGKVSNGVIEDAQDRVDPHIGATLDVLPWREVFLMLSDYVHWGIGPLVREVRLPVDSGNLLPGPYMDTNVDSWVFTIPAESLADVYKHPRNRLFARNVRAPLGDTSVARAVKKTLDTEPERFWFFNNGITIVCDRVDEVRNRGKTEALIVRNPQIINGQQTTVSLAKHSKGRDRASVVARVIRVSREKPGDRERFNDLVSKNVVAANWQNQTSASDLRSNEPQQIEIARALYRRDYGYVRKRGEDAMLDRFASKRTIKKEDIAKAVADCTLGPGHSLIQGESALFSPEEAHYDRIFKQRDPDSLLSCHWMRQNVSKTARGQGFVWMNARLVVQYFLWSELDALKGRRRRFVEESELWNPTRSEFTKVFQSLAGWVFRTAADSYIANAGKGQARVEANTYFKSRNPYPPLIEGWKSAKSAGRRKRFEADKKKLLELLVAV